MPKSSSSSIPALKSLDSQTIKLMLGGVCVAALASLVYYKKFYKKETTTKKEKKGIFG